MVLRLLPEANPTSLVPEGQRSIFGAYLLFGAC